MKLTRIGKTAASVVDLGNDLQILFSYGTPVAFWQSGAGFRKTSKTHSKTTSKHINKWLRSKGLDPTGVMEIPQEQIDDLVKI